MTRPRRHLGTALVVVVLSAPFLAISASVALALAPAIAILLILSLGYFPGETVIVRIRSISRDRNHARPVAEPVPSSLNLVRRTGRLIAYALAIRPPPLIIAALA